LLAALGSDIKKQGKGWTAKCPVHNDKDFAMSIKECADGSILAHCHSCGASGLDLYRTLELDLGELFGKKLEKDDCYMPHEIKEKYELDKIVVFIHEKGKVEKTLADRKRYKLAVARIKGTKDKYNL